MTLQTGARIWIPCEVKPGPFSDERVVRVRENGNDWLGFVQVKQLRDPILEGSTFIGARVVSVGDRSFKARLPGEAFNSDLFEGALANVRPLDSLQA